MRLTMVTVAVSVVMSVVMMLAFPVPGASDIALDQHSNFVRVYGTVIVTVAAEQGTGLASALIAVQSQVPELQGAPVLFFANEALDRTGISRVQPGEWVVVHGFAVTYWSCSLFCDNPSRLFAVDVYRWSWDRKAWDYFNHATLQWEPW